MVESSSISITPSQHADNHRSGGTDPLTGDVRIDAMGSTPSDETASRASGTIYQNTSSLPMMVMVDMVHDVANNVKTAVLKVGNASDLAGGVNHYNYIVRSYDSTANHNSCNVIIPPGFYYRLTLTNETIASWIEVL